MDLGLQGRTALVLAASSGLGLGVARGLAAEGARVLIAGRSRERLEEAGASFEAEPVIEVPGGVPVQDSQIEPSAAALDRDRSEPRHEPPPDAEPARPFTDKDVLEVKNRPAARFPP